LTAFRQAENFSIAAQMDVEFSGPVCYDSPRWFMGTAQILFMTHQTEEDTAVISGGAGFVTTHWSVVLNARGPATPEALTALEVLCRTYYYPLYAFVRWQGHDVHGAQDLTQEFFHRFVEKDYLASVAPEKGRFRSFLLASLKNFLNVARVRESAIKRGGRQTFISLDCDDLEERYLLEPKSASAAEHVYDRGWATTLMERALAALREEFQNEGKSEQFERLRPFLSREPAGAEYVSLAAAAHTTPGAISVAVHRLRQRYRAHVRSEVANTVAHPADVEEELRYLFIVLTAD
jgi:DNA-directed RNA polymerase specialized sigma24 family protein